MIPVWVLVLTWLSHCLRIPRHRVDLIDPRHKMPWESSGQTQGTPCCPSTHNLPSLIPAFSSLPQAPSPPIPLHPERVLTAHLFSRIYLLVVCAHWPQLCPLQLHGLLLGRCFHVRGSSQPQTFSWPLQRLQHFPQMMVSSLFLILAAAFSGQSREMTQSWRGEVAGSLG